MTTTLYLTQAEQKLFKALSDQMQEGWKVNGEEVVFQDSDELKSIRWSLAHFSSKRLQELQKQSGSITHQNLMEFLDEKDFENLSEADQAELFYVIGPVGLTLMIMAVLSGPENDEDIQFAAGLSIVRHHLEKSLAKVS